MVPSPRRPRREPRQQRGVATHLRVYEVAMAEYARVGVDAARVEDIVAAAGVSWGTFFHYFPTKEDVLLDAGVVVCRAFAAAAAQCVEAGHDRYSPKEWCGSRSLRKVEPGSVLTAG